jgi:hypothetical protein
MSRDNGATGEMLKDRGAAYGQTHNNESAGDWQDAKF